MPVAAAMALAGWLGRLVTGWPVMAWPASGTARRVRHPQQGEQRGALGHRQLWLMEAGGQAEPLRKQPGHGGRPRHAAYQQGLVEAGDSLAAGGRDRAFSDRDGPVEEVGGELP